MLKKSSTIIFTFFLLLGLLSLTHAQQDKPSISKGQLLPAPQIMRGAKLAQLNKASGTIVFEENFEASGNPWSISGSWAIGAPTSGPNGGHASTNCAATRLTGNYSNNADDWLITPSISLPTLSYPSSMLNLIFSEWFQIESEYDHGKVKVSMNGGTTWTELDDRSGSSDWRQSVVDLSTYAGQTIKVGFHFTSDGLVTNLGWYVDDVQIILEEPQRLGATLVSLNHQNFPFIYMNVAVDTFGVGFPDLSQSNFQVYENGVLQSDYFEVTPPDAGGGVRLADIVFLMDNSGSMGDEQSAVRNNVTDFVNNLTARGIDFALGLCRFGAFENNGYPIIEDNGILTSNTEYFKNDVWNRNVTSGGFEPGWDALYESTTAFSFRPGTQKIFILITDETPTDDGNVGNYSQNEAISILQANSITTFALLGLSNSHAISDYGVIAEQTNGKYFDIYSPFDEILDFISSQVASTYLIRYKSSNPVFDGTLRNVEVKISYAGNLANCEGSYIPGSAPTIQRTQATLDLHNRAWTAGTEFTIEADIVDNVAPYVQSATLYYRKTGIATYSSTNMNLYSGNTYRGTIPGGAVQTPGLDYYISATDGENTASEPSVDPINNPYQFAILPNIAPAITHTPATTLTPNTQIMITAQIADNTNLIVSAKLYYRKAAQLVYQHVDMRNFGGNNYEAIIPATYVTIDGVEYYLQAQDDFGVSGYYGTPDVPVSIMNSLFYVNEKESIINYFLGENFYVDAEQDAQSFTNQIEQKITAGTATNKDIEALRRLTLVEEASKVAYPGAVEIAQLSSKATLKASVALILAAAFGELEKLLKPLKDVPVLKVFYNAAKGAKETFSSLNISILKSMVGHIAGRLWPKLMELFPHLTQPEALSAADKIAWIIAPEIEKEVIDIGFEELISLQPIEDGLRGVYLSVYEGGLPGGILRVGGTEQAVMFSISDARSQNFQEGRVNIVTQTIRNVKESNITSENMIVENAINSKIDFAGTLGTIKLGLFAIVLLASIAAVIGGIIGCGPTGGIGCILSAIGGLGIFGSINAILPFFTVAEIGLYGWGMGEGLYRLHYSLPDQLNEVQKIAFDKTAGPLLLTNSPNEEVGTMALTSIPDHWADSLVVLSNTVAQKISEIRFLIQQGKWEEAGTKFESLSPNLEQLSSKQNIVNSVLDFSYLYNSSAPVSGLDSIYHYTGAYSAASDFGLGFSQFAIGFALLVKPTRPTLDTLLVILDESINRLQANGFGYKQTLDRFNSWGFQSPPIVSIIEFEIEEGKAGYTVLCRIKNISDRPVNDVATSLRGASDVDVRVAPDTDTLFSILNPTEEKEIRWQLNYYGLEKVLILDLDVHPLVVPGDFQGDRKMISQLITDTSPPTRGTLDNKNIYAYPNPFNPDVEEVTLRFKLANVGNVTINVTIKVYDASNTLVTTIISNFAMPANQELSVNWNGRNDKQQMVANGVYFYVIQSSSGEKGVGKVAVLR